MQMILAEKKGKRIFTIFLKGNSLSFGFPRWQATPPLASGYGNAVSYDDDDDEKKILPPFGDFFGNRYQLLLTMLLMMMMLAMLFTCGICWDSKQICSAAHSPTTKSCVRIKAGGEKKHRKKATTNHQL